MSKRKRKSGEKSGGKRPSYEELLRITGRQGQQIGAACESKVKNAFTLPEVPAWYRGYRKGAREEDAREMDCFILTDIGEIPVQIKLANHHPNRREFIERDCVCIPIVYVSMSDSESRTRRKVIHAVAQERARRIAQQKKGE